MKKVKLIVSAICSILLVAVSVIPAFAGNTGDTFISSFSVPGRSYYIVYPNSREKQDSSAMYLEITSSVYDNIYVEARGLTLLNSITYGATYDNTYNLTANGNGYGVNYVTCTRGTDYSIHSFIYEEGYRAATYAFKSPLSNVNENISGWWSPDSAYSHTDAY